MTIWVNSIVYNEENFIWFSLMSVVDYVDKILVWDTGSTDKTVEIIKEVKKLKGDKIEFREYGVVDNIGFTKARQEMLEDSDCDWIILLDGDEVWWKENIEKLIKTIRTKGKNLDAIAVPFINAVGDVYHHQDESEGDYQILGRKGHLTIRAINRKIPGLHVDKPYGQEGYFDNEGNPIQDRRNLCFLNTPYLHLTHLKRTSHGQRINKVKYQLGKALDKRLKLPEVFYEDYPEFISDPLKKRTAQYIMQSLAREPFRFIKKKIKNDR